MATTTEVMNTTIMTLSIDGTVVGDCVDASMSFTHSPRTITNKQDAGWKRLAEGLREFSFTTNFMYVPDHADFSFEDTYAFITGRTTGLGRLASTTVGDNYFEGTGYLGAANLNSNGVEDNVVADFVLEGTDALSTGAVT